MNPVTVPVVRFFPPCPRCSGACVVSQPQSRQDWAYRCLVCTISGLPLRFRTVAGVPVRFGWYG